MPCVQRVCPIDLRTRARRNAPRPCPMRRWCHREPVRNTRGSTTRSWSRGETSLRSVPPRSIRLFQGHAGRLPWFPTYFGPSERRPQCVEFPDPRNLNSGSRRPRSVEIHNLDIFSAPAGTAPRRAGVALDVWCEGSVEGGSATTVGLLCLAHGLTALWFGLLRLGFDGAVSSAWKTSRRGSREPSPS